MLDQAEFANLGPVRELFRMLEEKGRLLKILNECIASNYFKHREDCDRIGVGYSVDA